MPSLVADRSPLGVNRMLLSYLPQTFATRIVGECTRQTIAIALYATMDHAYIFQEKTGLLKVVPVLVGI